MYNYFFASLFSLLLIACGQSGDTADTIAINSEGWQVKDPAIFELPRLDSLATYNAYITVRNNNKYPFSNLFLIVSLQHPYGKTAVDTLEYKMARPDGSWLGAGIGNVKENKLFFKQNLIFNEAGNYTLHISHAVRNNGEPQGVSKLEGITDIGYSLETVK
ncbi:MAG: gliding motility lipoprotein GldH [Ulvibacter sp.]|nr:gliding motility lipoprotein GldH [Ulvibacter sp.]